MFNIKNLISKKEGFGVIEIVAVVAVIGILVGFNTPQFGNIVEKTQLVVDKLNNRDQMVKESEKEMSDPEFLELSDKTISETETLKFYIKAKNPPGDDKLRFTSSNLPKKASLNNITGEFIWETDYGDMGIHNISITISNSSFSTTDDFNIEVLQSNSPPVIESIEDIIANEGETINFNIPVSDRENDLLTYVPINIPDRATLNNNGEFNWDINYDEAGNYANEISVMDSEHTVYENFNIKVNNVNTLPQLITIEDKVINETDIFNLDIEASDTDGDELTYSVNGLPADASIDTSEGSIYWETDYESEGSYNVEYAVNDGVNNVAKNFSLKVNHLNAPPVLNGLSIQVGEEASLLEFDITASDIDNDSLTFSSNDLPTGANLTENGTFSWTPSYTDSGEYTFNVEATDGIDTDNKNYTVQINDINASPHFTNIVNKSVNENSTFSYQLTANDIDNDTLTYSITNSADLPNDLTISSNGLIKWNTDYTDEGTYTVEIQVTDGTLSDTASFDLIVNHVNAPPILNALSTQVGEESSLLEFNITGSDIDNDTLTFSSTNLPTGANLTENGIFSWTPNYTDSGEYTFNVEATDGIDTVNKDYTVQINDINAAPVINSLGTQIANETETLSFNITASDIDNDSLTFSSTDLPEGASLSESGFFKWNTDYEDEGTFDFNVTVSDGQLNDTDNYTVQIAHTNYPVELNDLGTQTVNEQDLLEFNIPYTDIDSDTLTFSSNDLPSGASLTEDGEFSWRPSYSQSGTHTFNVIVNDGSSTDNKDYSVEVNQVNVAPEFTNITNKFVNENSTFSYQLTANDIDNDTLTYSITNSADLPNGLTITSNGLIEWNTDYTDEGNYTVEVEVTDVSLSDTASFNLTVNHFNAPPVLNDLSAQFGEEASLLEFDITASDIDNDTLTFSSDDLPTGANLSEDGTFSWTPSYTDSGNYTFNVEVTDGIDTVSKNYTIQINDINAAPVINSLETQTANETETLSFNVTASDIDNDSLTFSSTDLPDNATLSESGSFEWNTDYEDEGTFNFNVTVSDGSLTDTGNYTVEIAHTNYPVRLNDLVTQTVNEQDLLEFTVPHTDIDSDTLTFSSNDLPSGASLTENGEFSWRPGYSQSGTHTFNVIVNDGSSTDNKDYIVEVNQVNVAPEFTNITNKSVNENSIFSYQLTANDIDIDNDTLTYSITNSTDLPNDLTISNNGLIEWNTDYTDEGIYTVDVKVTDGSLSDTASFDLTVNDVNRPPEALSISDKAVTEGYNLNFSVDRSDPDGDTLSYTSSNLPTGASLDSNTGVFDWTPSLSQAGIYNITINTDDGNTTTSDSFTITVNNNAVPTMSAISDKTITTDDTLNITPSASDSQGESLTFTANGLPGGASFNSSNGNINWSSPSEGSWNITITVEDEVGQSVNGSFNFVVEKPVQLEPVSVSVADYANKSNSKSIYIPEGTTVYWNFDLKSSQGCDGYRFRGARAGGRIKDPNNNIVVNKKSTTMGKNENFSGSFTTTQSGNYVISAIMHDEEFGPLFNHPFRNDGFSKINISF